ncbi:MAG: LCP family protein [Clostridia bacterium]|nr:LCP family protein [Clostridia bacterium]
MKRKKKTLKKMIPSVILFVVLLAVMAWFVIGLFNTNLVPEKYLLILAGVFYVLAVVILFLTLNPGRRGAFITGIVLSVVMVGGMAFANGYIKKGVNTLEKITGSQMSVADMGIYVRSEDASVDILDVADYTFGIIAEMDRKNTDTMLEKMTETLGKTPVTQSYGDITEVMEALLTTREVEAVVINSAFLGICEEMEEYADIRSRIHAVLSEHIEVPVDTSLHGNEGETDPEQIIDTQTYNDVFTMYISGIDTYGKLSTTSRSDVNIVATVNTKTRQVLLVSIPRDAYVATTVSNGVPDKLTNAGIYGINCSKGTLERIYKTKIDYYFRVNFSGFEDIIDALGGITVESPVAFTSRVNGHYFKKGENKLNGENALAFVRERKAFADGDHQRGRNQMTMVKAVMEKAMSPAILTGYTDLMNSVADSFETSMPYEVIAELVKMQLEEGGGWNIQTYSVSGTGASKKPYSQKGNAYVMDIDYSTVDTAIAKMNQVKNGEILQAE